MLERRELGARGRAARHDAGASGGLPHTAGLAHARNLRGEPLAGLYSPFPTSSSARPGTGPRGTAASSAGARGGERAALLRQLTHAPDCLHRSTANARNEPAAGSSHTDTCAGAPGRQPDAGGDRSPAQRFAALVHD